MKRVCGGRDSNTRTPTRQGLDLVLYKLRKGEEIHIPSALASVLEYIHKVEIVEKKISS